MTVLSLSEALQKIATHERGDELARFVRDCLLDAASSRSRELDAVVARLARERRISRENAAIGTVNAIDAMTAAGTDPEAALWAAALLARAIALDPPQGVDAEDKLAERLAWIAANTPVDSLSGIDAALGDKAEGLWGALADLVQRHEARAAGSRAEAVVAAAALGGASHPGAQKRAAELASSLKLPLLARLVNPGSSSAIVSAPQLLGELSPAPRGPFTTFLLAACGWLLLANVGRVFGRLALKYRRPAQVQLTGRGVVVRSKTQLLGKVLRERELLIPLEGLARATREVRFPRMGTYAGLLALALGSYLGVSWFIDGVRAASLSLVAVGMLVILIGIGLDFALATLIPGSKGKCRVVFVPRKGAAVCVAQLDMTAADSAMAALSKLGGGNAK